ncbi:MAG: hypothetical protein CMH62_02090 [Nanoarchaeota archaeon]|nr:hypothetical protein [Nanoarchaeota archaeon]|tara:strand:- start:787 stop:1182 length:396 start_codon:yes stop_codon:yes gene_type:complete
METKTINQKVVLKASPHEIYEMLLDSKKHEEFTGQKADISKHIGGKFKAFDGWVEGETIDLIPDELIVQKWRGKDWEEEYFSKVTFELKKVEEGTEITLTHEDVPEDKYESVESGWKEHYWDKMKKVLEKE